MYRSPAQLPPRNEASAELVYDAAFERQRGSFSAPALIGAYAAVITGVTLASASPLVSALACVVLCVGTVWWWRMQPDGAMILRVDEGYLTLRLRRQKGATAAPIARLRLDEIVDVTLDSDEHERIEYGSSATTARQAAEYRIAHDDNAHRVRVLLQPREGKPVRIGLMPLPYQEATEWLGKTRRFLRQHEWLPEDERAASSSAPIALDK